MIVKFKDLSIPLKVAVVGAYFSIVIYGLAFLIGFIQGLMS